jgi:hypothetical protein
MDSEMIHPTGQRMTQMNASLMLFAKKKQEPRKQEALDKFLG